ncbi:hypothetical protein QF026_004586 [Streptomyces aurantiacus]|nr:hypothetical protein [Streptomyces aurantiacus]
MITRRSTIEAHSGPSPYCLLLVTGAAGMDMDIDMDMDMSMSMSMGRSSVASVRPGWVNRFNFACRLFCPTR